MSPLDMSKPRPDDHPGLHARRALPWSRGWTQHLGNHRSLGAGRRALVTSLLVLMLAGTGGPAAAAEIVPVRYIAPNGLTVLVLEQHALPILQIHALIKAGAAQDPPSKAGLANLVADLLDEGTRARSATQIAEQIDFVGGDLSMDVSADYTTVSASVLTKDTGLGFELLADVILNPSFPKKEFSRVRSQVLGEIQSEEEAPELVAEKAFNRLVFGTHPYRWPVNGTQESVKKITRQDVREFFRREYLPNQTILTIVGDIPPAQAAGLVAQRFGDWKPRTPSARRYQKPKRMTKPVSRLIDRRLTQSTIVLGHMGISRTNPDFYAVRVMNYILGSGGFSSRLMDSIRDKQGLAYGVYSSFHANLMPGAFSVSLQTRNETTNRAIEQVVTEIKGMREKPVTIEELADAKAYLMGSFPRRLDTTGKLARVLSLVEFYGLGLNYFTDYPTWIEQVTGEDVLRVAKKYLHPDRYALIVVGDQAKAKVRQ